jgi:hypothetical protein
VEGTGNAEQYTWDTAIHPYIGANNNLSQQTLTSGATDESLVSQTLRCPNDNTPNLFWTTGDPTVGRRTYAMNAIGPEDMATASWDHGLPKPIDGVGIYWDGISTAQFAAAQTGAPGYKTSVVLSPSGTLNLVEEASGDNTVGNVWPSIAVAPCSTDSGQGWGECYQYDTADYVNQGAALYKIQGNHFEYCFFDNHVAILTMKQTVGSGTTNEPKGMWTLNPTD